METRQIISVTFLTLIMIVFTLVVATGENGYTPKENEEFYGIWINPEYNDRTFMAKLLCKPDGTWYEYSMTTKSGDSWVVKGEYTINDKWTDANGDIWYKVTYTRITSTYTYYELTKISKSGTIKESVYTINNYPEKIDPEDSKLHYRIRYRQE